ncbi:MAG: sigma-70 family RNA polymerase sigma factor [Planctomycetota bacterium]
MKNKVSRADSSWKVEESIRSARNGSFSAVGQLLDHYRDYLLGVANEELSSDLVPKVSPSDLVQETFYEASKNFPKFKGKSEPELRAWLRQIFLNNLLDVQRRFRHTEMRDASREVPLSVNGMITEPARRMVCPDLTPSDHAVASEMNFELERALGRLPEDQRKVIELRSFERRSFEDVGMVIGKSADAARKIWSRAVEQLAAEVPTNDSSIRSEH